MTPDIGLAGEVSRPLARGGEATAIGDANPSLRARYEVYRRQQGRDLLALLPREGVRALLRAVSERGGGNERAGVDEFEALARHCAELLPLPPFEVWARDFARNRAAYGGPEAPPLAPTARSDAPVTVAVVEFVSERGEEWVASLELTEVAPLWAGTVRFHDPLASITCRTGPILRESHPEEVRARFAGFDRATLDALLRSALP